MVNAKIKIAIVSHSLGVGGAERFAGTLSYMLESLGYEIHNIIVNDSVDYHYAGRLYNLEQKSASSIGLYKKIKKGFLLRAYLKKNNISVVIDNRTRNYFWRELMTVMMYRNYKTYYIIHSYNLLNYLPVLPFFGKLLYQNAHKIICVSKAIQDKVSAQYGLQNTVTIYNPIQEIHIGNLSVQLPEKYILFFGRLDEKVKNITLLLEAFKASEISTKGYQLLILGDGPDRDYLVQTIQKLGLNDVVQLIAFVKNPFLYVQNARFTVLSSRYEGFPMSVIESLSLGVPVVSVDCLSGPSEVIQNEYNGLLVQNHNTQALGMALKRMVTENDLFQKCSANAKQSVAHLTMQKIAEQWRIILEN
ncbi:glycosyltransferase [Flavobacterium sp. CYK-55]|uniref:glycosyltransferase n=1 Tax=Flavobacterium sp. CYK-55 TaxID=2835529 RepID=UPI001BCEEA97|nr:glycosyltransferase [Flavobacterium sp. CYK-55]MBS7788109.1 glycosyltransferase [Flavobacterium sp. CYK-55]